MATPATPGTPGTPVMPDELRRFHFGDPAAQAAPPPQGVLPAALQPFRGRAVRSGWPLLVDLEATGEGWIRPLALAERVQLTEGKLALSPGATLVEFGRRAPLALAALAARRRLKIARAAFAGEAQELAATAAALLAADRSRRPEGVAERARGESMGALGSRFVDTTQLANVVGAAARRSAVPRGPPAAARGGTRPARRLRDRGRAAVDRGAGRGPDRPRRSGASGDGRPRALHAGGRRFRRSRARGRRAGARRARRPPRSRGSLHSRASRGLARPSGLARPRAAGAAARASGARPADRQRAVRERALQSLRPVALGPTRCRSSSCRATRRRRTRSSLSPRTGLPRCRASRGVRAAGLARLSAAPRGRLRPGLRWPARRSARHRRSRCPRGFRHRGRRARRLAGRFGARLGARRTPLPLRPASRIELGASAALRRESGALGRLAERAAARRREVRNPSRFCQPGGCTQQCGVHLRRRGAPRSGLAVAIRPRPGFHGSGRRAPSARRVAGPRRRRERPPPAVRLGGRYRGHPASSGRVARPGARDARSTGLLAHPRGARRSAQCACPGGRRRGAQRERGARGARAGSAFGTSRP